jgi:hypothetical protein
MSDALTASTDSCTIPVGMTCAMRQRVQRRSSALGGVSSANVNLMTGAATVAYDVRHVARAPGRHHPRYPLRAQGCRRVERGAPDAQAPRAGRCAICAGKFVPARRSASASWRSV